MFIEAKDDGGGSGNWTTGAISRAKLQSNHHHQQINIQFFYMPFLSPNQQCQTLKGNDHQCTPCRNLLQNKVKETWGFFYVVRSVLRRFGMCHEKTVRLLWHMGPILAEYDPTNKVSNRWRNKNTCWKKYLGDIWMLESYHSDNSSRYVNALNCRSESRRRSRLDRVSM